jgi:hypothetical protein
MWSGLQAWCRVDDFSRLAWCFEGLGSMPPGTQRGLDLGALSRETQPHSRRRAAQRRRRQTEQAESDVQRFTAYVIWTGFVTVLYRGVIDLIADRLIGWLPEAATLLEEARHYGWMVGVALGLLTAGLLVRSSHCRRCAFGAGRSTP